LGASSRSKRCSGRRQGSVAALEILINTAASDNLIRQGKLRSDRDRHAVGRCAWHAHPWTHGDPAGSPGRISGAEAYKKGIIARPVRGREGRLLKWRIGLPRVAVRQRPLHLESLPSRRSRPTYGVDFKRARARLPIRCAAGLDGTPPIMIRAQQQGQSAEQLIADMAAEHPRDYSGDLLVAHDISHSSTAPRTGASQ